jgi:hypothetical protein
MELVHRIPFTAKKMHQVIPRGLLNDPFGYQLLNLIIRDAKNVPQNTLVVLAY